MLRAWVTRYAADMTHSHRVVALRPQGAGIPGRALPPTRDEVTAAAAALCAQALSAALAAPAAPAAPAELLALARQLADCNRLLGRLARAGAIAADAYEAGRADERASWLAGRR